MRVSAKADYALRAAAHLAAAGDGPVKGSHISEAEHIPLKFLENILAELRHAGIVASQRGAEGGYWLARPAKDVSLAEIIRIVEGPLAAVQGVRPDALPSDNFQPVWIAVRANLRAVLEHVSLADVATGRYPAVVRRLTAKDDAWAAR